MLKLELKISAKDDHEIITFLEGCQWAIAGGVTEGKGWVLTKDNEDEVKP